MTKFLAFEALNGNEMFGNLVGGKIKENPTFVYQTMVGFGANFGDRKTEGFINKGDFEVGCIINPQIFKY